MDISGKATSLQPEKGIEKKQKKTYWIKKKQDVRIAGDWNWHRIA
jgi:hypothetical protein